MATSTALPFSRKAAQHIRFGIPVIPLVPNDKFPPSSMTGWQSERKYTTDPAVIAGWNAENPDYNIGLVAMAEEHGFCFLEFDGTPGLKAICKERGQEYPCTRIHRSGRGGGHYIFKHTAKSIALGNRSANNAEGEWFSFRADRKYLVGAGSVHPNGNLYTVHSDVEPIPIPDWLVDYIAEQTKPVSNPTQNSPEPEVVDDFDFDDWCEHYSSVFTIPNDNQDGWMVTDVCPWAGGRHEHSTGTGFYFDGVHLRFHCFAQGCDGFEKGIGATIKMMNEKVGDPYPYPIWPEREVAIPVDDIVSDPIPETERSVTAEELFADSKPTAAVGETEVESQVLPEAGTPAKTEDPLKFPDDAMYGKLGEMAYAMKMPRGLAYPALIGCYSGKPAHDEMDGTRINAYVVLLAGVGAGKDTAIKRALQILKLDKGMEYEKATPASDRGLGELLGDKSTGKKGQQRQSGPKRMLLVCDEFMEVLQKSRIENSGLFQTLQTLFDDNRKVFADKRGRQTVDCRLSIVGSIPVNEKNPELFAELFGRKSSHGLLSRILLGYSGTKFNYKPWTCPDISVGKSVSARVDTSFDAEDFASPADEWQPAPLVEGLTPEASVLCEAWEDPADESGRLKFYLMKVAILTASANGDALVTAEGMQAASKFMAWQAKLREVFKPGLAEDIVDARATERIINTLRRKAENMGDDEYIPWRKVSHDCKWVESFGSTVVDRVLNSLINCGELEAKQVEDEKGKLKPDKRWVKVVGKVPHRGKLPHPDSSPNEAN
jgi:hypothetical protein